NRPLRPGVFLTFSATEADLRGHKLCTLTVGVGSSVRFEYARAETRGMSKPIERLPFKDGEPSYVWAFCVGKDCTQRDDESIEAFVRRAEWTLTWSVEQVEKKK